MCAGGVSGCPLQIGAMGLLCDNSDHCTVEYPYIKCTLNPNRLEVSPLQRINARRETIFWKHTSPLMTWLCYPLLFDPIMWHGMISLPATPSSHGGPLAKANKNLEE